MLLKVILKFPYCFPTLSQLYAKLFSFTYLYLHGLQLYRHRLGFLIHFLHRLFSMKHNGQRSAKEDLGGIQILYRPHIIHHALDRKSVV